MSTKCGNLRCRHPIGWHYKNEGSCLECGCLRFNPLRARLANALWAMRKIAAFHGRTILCDPADYDFDAEQAHEGGAAKAFWEASDLAIEAIKKDKELRR